MDQDQIIDALVIDIPTGRVCDMCGAEIVNDEDGWDVTDWGIAFVKIICTECVCK